MRGQRERGEEAPRLRGVLALAVSGLALVFLGLALVLVLRPDAGAALFGIAADGAGARAYVRAVAIRDLALSLYMLALVRWASRRAVAILLGVTTVIPLCDLALLLLETSRLSLFYGAIHGASAAIFAFLSGVLMAQERRR